MIKKLHYILTLCVFVALYSYSNVAFAADYIVEAEQVINAAHQKNNRDTSTTETLTSSNAHVIQLEDGVYFVELPDPIYGINKAVLFFNTKMDRIVIRPITSVYRTLLPVKVRGRIVNVFNNLSEPIHFANDLLQGDVGQALATTWRFILNSTIGVLGLFDVSTALGIEKSERNFNSTLSKYGVGPGIYVMLPIFGPTSSRGAISLIADAFTYPLTYLPEPEVYAAAAARAISKRDQYFEEINDVLDKSTDPYATIKSIYEQKEINKS